MLPNECKCNTNETSFELPVDSPSLFLVARGGQSSGNLHVVQSSEIGDTVKVEVVTKTDFPEARLRTMICDLKRKKGGVGVGIFASFS